MFIHETRMIPLPLPLQIGPHIQARDPHQKYCEDEAPVNVPGDNMKLRKVRKAKRSSDSDLGYMTKRLDLTANPRDGVETSAAGSGEDLDVPSILQGGRLERMITVFRKTFEHFKFLHEKDPKEDSLEEGRNFFEKVGLKMGHAGLPVKML